MKPWILIHKGQRPCVSTVFILGLNDPLAQSSPVHCGRVNNILGVFVEMSVIPTPPWQPQMSPKGQIVPAEDLILDASWLYENFNQVTSLGKESTFCIDILFAKNTIIFLTQTNFLQLSFIQPIFECQLCPALCPLHTSLFDKFSFLGEINDEWSSWYSSPGQNFPTY